MHEKHMEVAIHEALKGIGKVNPNPLVGAVIVKGESIVSLGHHDYYGGPHAEVNAISKLDKNDLLNATIYVTLEPCSHFGKTPPCTDLIIKSGIKKCVVGCLDPNPLVAGKGVKLLQEAGIEVIVGVLEEECKNLNSVFFKYIENKTPYIFIKCGITLDGKIATQNFSSKWITNSQARNKVQNYRNFFSGILVGANTVLQDNPSLTCHLENSRDPYRIILDRNLTISEEYNIILENKDNKTIIVTLEENIKTEKFKIFQNKYNIKFITFNTNESLTNILKKIGALGIDSILVEGGSSIISQFFMENLYDGGEIFIAPKILGDSNAIPFVNGFSPMNIQDGIELKNITINTYGDNVGFNFYKEGKLCLLD